MVASLTVALRQVGVAHRYTDSAGNFTHLGSGVTPPTADPFLGGRVELQKALSLSRTAGISC